VQGPGPPCRREVQPGGTTYVCKLPLCWIRVWEGWSRLKKTREAGCRNGGAQEAGRGNWVSLFLPTPSFMASVEED